ncbi:helix-turn-helix transcriptional regulator [Streptomyces sp. NBC_00264]|uniref:helix-turn-helix domain-containing protein n=1 Tax=unclassified Streptomyces TaxID=2593676 RepID=UPI00225BEDB2|nr:MULTISPECIES: helix-turn-helix transcriptional regulator [unclassified Streptomyces]MCX5160774.1 helix-turn-helix transcriptional regulator [Streptomyces sp. NBC_00305]MCX5219297.1 helix-turn-helix transcriptional regulator [Streptomyces sp. NBC_00264]
MATRKEIDGSASVPQFYGKELRFKREEAGLTLKKLVDGSFYGITYLSEIEHGHRRMPEDLAQHVDQVLKTDGFFRRRCEDVRKARRKGHAEYFDRVLDAEKNAETIEQWSPNVFPGLLQTRPYARALHLAERLPELQKEAEAKVDARLERAQLFERSHRSPQYWNILSESLLRLPILPSQQMAEQLDHVAELTRRGRIFTQVIPWNSGVHPLMLGNALVLDFADAPPFAYTEGQYHGVTVDDPVLVKQYRRSYDLLRATALPPEVSLAMIEKAAEEYRNGLHTNRLDQYDLL